MSTRASKWTYQVEYLNSPGTFYLHLYLEDERADVDNLSTDRINSDSAYRRLDLLNSATLGELNIKNLKVVEDLDGLTLYEYP